MTKPLLQGRIGYWIDGKLVYLPRRPSSTTCKKKKIDNKKKTLNKDGKECKIHLPGGNIFIGTERTVITDIMRCASKQPNMSYLLRTLQMLRNKITRGIISFPFYFKIPNQRSRMTKEYMKYISPIFLPDADERSALYYACLIGYDDHVEFYLSLAVVLQYRSITTSSLPTYNNVSGDTYMTFYDWMFFYRYKQFPFLTQNEYTMCVLNSLRQNTKNILMKKKYNIHKAFTVIESYLQSGGNSRNESYLNPSGSLKSINTEMKHTILLDMKAKNRERIDPSINHRTRKQKRPTINLYDDSRDYLDYYNLDWDENEDENYQHDDVNCTYDHNDDNVDEKHHTPDMTVFDDDIDHAGSLLQSLEECSIMNVDDSSYIFCDDLLLDEHNESETKNLFISIDMNHDQSHFNKNILIDEIRSESDSNWDIISDVQSYDTFICIDKNKDTLESPSISSYKDILLSSFPCKQQQLADKNHNPHDEFHKSTRSDTNNIITIKEEIDEVEYDGYIEELADWSMSTGILYDADFERDVVKYIRGGKHPFGHHRGRYHRRHKEGRKA